VKRLFDSSIKFVHEDYGGLDSANTCKLYSAECTCYLLSRRFCRILRLLSLDFFKTLFESKLLNDSACHSWKGWSYLHGTRICNLSIIWPLYHQSLLGVTESFCNSKLLRYVVIAVNIAIICRAQRHHHRKLCENMFLKLQVTSPKLGGVQHQNANQASRTF
jgi:hypothetical protein